jgi:hypothetical protein
MTPEQWLTLGEAFNKWPFKPDVLEDETQFTESGRLSIEENSGYVSSQTVGVLDETLDDENEGAETEEDELDDIFNQAHGVAT